MFRKLHRQFTIFCTLITGWLRLSISLVALVAIFLFEIFYKETSYPAGEQQETANPLCCCTWGKNLGGE